MAYCLIATILLTYSPNTAAKVLPIQPLTEYYQKSLEDIIKNGQNIGAIIPESVTVSTDDKEDILKIVKEFIGNENDVKRTLFFCKEGLCKILNGDDSNDNENKTDGIINAQKKKAMKNSNEEKIKEIFKAKENPIISFEATHNRANKEEDPEDTIESMPKMKLGSQFKGHKYIRLQANTDPFVVTMTTPALPKLMKFHFPRTRVTMNTFTTPRIFFDNIKLLKPDSIDEVIRQYQMYPGAGCVYVKGCDGVPKHIIHSPQAMALIAKIFREIPEPTDEKNVMSFYLQKYDPQDIYFEDDGFRFKPKASTTTTTMKSNSECFFY